DEDRAVAGTVRRAAEAARQELHRSAHRRHRPAARHWIDVTHLESVAGVAIAATAHPLERLARAFVGVVEDWAGEAAVLVVYGQKSASEAGCGVALGTPGRESI